MDTSPSPPVEPDILGRIGAFLLFTAGVSALFAGGQVWSVVIFRDAWTEAIPVLHALSGLFACWLASQVAYPRRWAVVAALLLMVALGCLGVPWAWWLMYNGLFTALSVFAPGWATLGLLVLAIATPGLWRVAGNKSAADAENVRLAAEAAAAGYGFTAPPRGRSGWVLAGLYLLVGIPFLTFGLAVAWPDDYARIEARVLGVLSGRNPFGTAFVDAADDYPYSGSPLEWYLDYEAKWLPLDRELVLRMADDIAEDVGWRLSAATGESDPVAGEAALWAEGRQKEIPLWIAQNLRDRQVFYHAESLFSRSFDPDVHTVGSEQIHLDCDQLAFLYLHVAMRLDLAMKVLPSPYHVYLRYDPPDGGEPLTIETTEFRSIDVHGTHVDFMGESLGEEYFVDEDYYRSGRSGTWASSTITAAAGLYEPWTDRDIKDNIVANVLVGLDAAGKSQYPGEAEAVLPGTRSITLVNNLYRYYTRQAAEALDAGDLSAAEAQALRARAIRAEFGGLMIRSATPEEDILATIDVNRPAPEGGTP